MRMSQGKFCAQNFDQTMAWQTVKFCFITGLIIKIEVQCRGGVLKNDKIIYAVFICSYSSA